MRKLIITIVGNSGSGKTTLGKYLSRNLGYNWVCSYTTRPRRKDEVNGVDHQFVSESEIPDKSKMIAYGIFGNYQYWATFDQFTELPNVYVIDEKSLVKMEQMLVENNIKSYDLLKVYIKRNNIDVDEERIKRDEDRYILPECYYDLVIENNGDLESFLKKSMKEISEIVNVIK